MNGYRPRLKDVAAAAGVSPATASRVLSGKANVSDAARAAVLAASSELDYRGDSIARALRTQRTGMVGMLVPDIANPFFAELIEALTRALQSAGIDLLLADSHGSIEQEARWLVSLPQRRVDGLLVVPAHHQQSFPALAEAATMAPVVQLDRRVDELRADYAAVDKVRGMTLLMEHLVAGGAHSVALINATDASSSGLTRRLAFEAAIAHQPGLTVTAELCGGFSSIFGREAVRELTARGQLPDAIVCGSDVIAVGALTELRVQGLHVPEDVKLTGFDGIAMAEMTEPAITTVVQPVAEIAAAARRLLELRVDGDAGPPELNEIEPELRVRASSGQWPT